MVHPNMNVDSLAKLLGEQFRRVVDRSEIEVKWKSLDLRVNEETLLALTKLMEKDPFTFLPLVQYIVPRVQSVDSCLVELVIVSAEKTTGDLVAGYLFGALSELASNNFDSMPDLIRRILESVSNLRGGIAGVLLGHMYLHRPETDPSLLVEKLNSNDLHNRICGLRAIAIAGSRLDNISNKTRDLILGMVSSKESEILMEVPGALTAVFRRGDNKVIEIFRQLSQSDNDILKINVVNALHYDKAIDTKSKLELLSNYAETTHPKIQEIIGYCLYEVRAEADINVVMDIVFKIIRNSSDGVGGSIVWVLSECGKSRLEEMAEIVSRWVMNATEDEKLRWELFLGPVILTELGSENRTELVRVLSQWTNDSKLRQLILSTIGELLRDLNIRGDGRIDEVLDNCMSCLSSIAMQERLDPEKIMKSETQKILKCGKLLQSLEAGKPDYDFDTARQNLKNFSNLRKFVGEEWVSRVEKKQERSGELLFLLSSYNDSDINNLPTQIQQESDTNKKFQMTLTLRNNLRRRSLLEHVDELLSRIDSNRHEIGSLRNKLQGEDFATGLSELEFIGRMRRNYNVQCYPSVDRIVDNKSRTSRLDALVNIDGLELLVEVITPRLMPELDYIGSASIPERLADIIWNEYREQLAGMRVKRDVVIVIDKSRSEIQYESAQSYMEGPLSWTMLFDTKTGRAVEGYVERKPEGSMGRMEPEMNVILGLLIYDRVLGNDLKYHIRGRFIENPDPLITEKRVVIDKLTKGFVG